MQLAQVGAQNSLVNGNPSMTHFRAVYRRHTNFAMEHIRMSFTSSNLDFVFNGTRTLTCKIDRYAQLLHDTYLVLTLPDIWSPMVYLGPNTPPPTGYDSACTAIGYEFQWIKNIGYNLIDHIEIVANGVKLQSLTGEWLKMYSYFTHDGTKRGVVDQMVGNVPEIYDPANAYDRTGQYPHAVTPTSASTVFPFSATPEPSIRARQLVIPLHFWFCENPGLALPLVSMQNSETYINVVLRPLNQLYTVIDVNPMTSAATVTNAVSTGSAVTFTTGTIHGLSVGTSVTLQRLQGTTVQPLNNVVLTVTSVPTTTTFTVASPVTISSADNAQANASIQGGATNPNYGQRIQPTSSQPMNLFLTPPSLSGGTLNNTVNTFSADPHLEGNFIYLTDMEMNQLAVADQTFLLKEVRHINAEGQFGANTDIEIPMFNLVTRIVFTAQRSDKMLTNDWDNYTNWSNRDRAPFAARDPTAIGDTLFSSGQSQISSIYPRDSMEDGALLFDGNLRFQTKPTSYFSLLQAYKHTTGSAPFRLPGVYMYSFGLNNDQYQPSGAVNGSMFKKVTLRISLQQPLPVGTSATQIVCILASTALSQHPVEIPPENVNLRNPDGSMVYPPGSLMSVVKTVTNNNILFTYTYNVGVYVESINYLRIVSGIANLVFAS
jgi:hypothetical protein